MAYEKLFEPGRIGTMTIKNRGVMAPMGSNLAGNDGNATDSQIRYYQERAKGGIGMIVNEYTGVDDVDSMPSVNYYRVARDHNLAAAEALVDAVHMYDCRIVAQLHHAGSTSNPAYTGRDNIAPSAVPIADGKPVPREMTLEDIKRVQGKFIDAAVRCKKVGYDAVELHGAHGYLLTQFFNRYYNRRTDEYGGSVENRCRFIAEIIAGIREKLGPKYPILVRMCGDEMTPIEGFFDLEEGIEIAKYLESLGIDAIDISMGSSRNADANCEPFSYKPGWKKHVAKAYKEALNIPVIATNTIKNPDFAEQLLEEGVCDFVAMGRSQLADPEFMNKAKAGRANEIRKCIGCLYCRERILGEGLPIRCAVNARTAREIEFPDYRNPVRTKFDGAGRKVAVIGAGPAGMEAARVLALRGYAPVIFDKAEQPGGTLNIADKPPLKDKITALIDSMVAELNALGVKWRLGEEATVENVRELEADAIGAPKLAGVIVACGAQPVIPNVPGADGPNVVTAEDVITGKAEVGGSAGDAGRIVIIGSGLTGLETAEMLLADGHKVAIVEMLDQIGPGIFGAILNDEMSRIKPFAPDLYPGHALVSIQAGSANDGQGSTVTVEELATGKQFDIEADTVIMAAGIKPRTDVVDLFKANFNNVLVAGDARKGGRIATAIREGFETGWIF